MDNAANIRIYISCLWSTLFFGCLFLLKKIGEKLGHSDSNLESGKQKERKMTRPAQAFGFLGCFFFLRVE